MNENNTNCPICSRNMKSFVTTTKCGHRFHNRCVRKWYGTKYANGQDVTCPMCRESIKANMKSEFIHRAKDVLIQLHEFHGHTVELFYFLMTSQTKTAKHFRESAEWNRVNRISTLLRTTPTNISTPLYYEIFTKVVMYVMFDFDFKNGEINTNQNRRRHYNTPEITRYTTHVHRLLKSLLLLYKNIYEIFSRDKRIVLRIEHPMQPGVRKDIMKNKYLNYLRDIVSFYHDFPNRSSNKPAEFREIMRLFELCCVSSNM